MPPIGISSGDEAITPVVSIHTEEGVFDVGVIRSSPAGLDCEIHVMESLTGALSCFSVFYGL